MSENVIFNESLTDKILKIELNNLSIKKCIKPRNADRNGFKVIAK